VGIAAVAAVLVWVACRTRSARRTGTT
jgi:hypothetical protein